MEEKKLTTEQILDLLMKRNKMEIDYCLYFLLLKGKIDYVEISKLYTKALEKMNNDRADLLSEADVCVLFSFTNENTKDKEDTTNYDATQRKLHYLNIRNNFAIEMLNRDWEYDKEYAKSKSYYELMKRNNLYG